METIERTPAEIETKLEAATPEELQLAQEHATEKIHELEALDEPPKARAPKIVARIREEATQTLAA